MLAVKVLLLDVVGSRLDIMVYNLGKPCHLCDLFKDNGVVNGLICILAPGEWPMVLAQNSLGVPVVYSPLLEGLDDNKAGVLLIGLVYLLIRKIPCAGDGA